MYLESKINAEGYKIFMILSHKRNMDRTDIETIYKVHFILMPTCDAKSKQ
jgi:uncharacterized protein (DUF302 family)